MKSIKIALVSLAIAAGSVSTSFAQLITSFQADASNGGGWTLTTNGVGLGSTITGTEGAGDLLFETSPVNFNVTGKTGITITANVTTAPANGFKFSLFDAVGREATASFDWASFTTGPKTVFSLFDTVSPSFSFAAVTSWNLISGGSGVAINATILSAAASTAVIPEPSAYASFAGLAVLGLVAYRRRRIAA